MVSPPHEAVQEALRELSAVLDEAVKAVSVRVGPGVCLRHGGSHPHRPAKHLWRNLVAVDLSFYKSYISEEIRDEGRAQGRAEDVLLVLEQRGLDVSDDVRRRVTDCTDPELLRHWLTRAVTAPKAEEIFEDE